MKPNRIDPEGVPYFTLACGERVPCMGAGTFASDGPSAQTVSRAVADAVRFGYRLIDCASVYGNEAQIGEALAEVMGEGEIKREALFITSKVWNDRHGEGDVLLSLAQTLRDLRLKRIDAYFVHWPFPNYHAPGCDGDSRNPDSKPFSVETFMATWRQMERIYDMGLARHLGMSNMTVKKLKAVLPLCRVRPSLIEMELHPAFQQPELFDYVRAEGILPIGYCPIGSPQRPERDRTPEDIADTQLPVIRAIAEKHGIHPAVVCLKWAVQRGQLPIPFSVQASHYEANLRGIMGDPLTEAEMDAIRALDANCRLIKGQVFLWPGAEDWRALWDE